MASVPSEPGPVSGRLDRAGRLISADPQLEALQREAGSALGQALALEVHQPAGHLGAGLGVDQPLTSRTSDLDLLLGIQPAVEFVAQEQHADQAALAPQRHSPDCTAIACRVERYAHRLWRSKAGRQLRQGRQRQPIRGLGVGGSGLGSVRSQSPAPIPGSLLGIG